MSLSDIFIPCPWAVMPDALDPFFRALFNPSSQGAGQAVAAVPASGEDGSPLYSIIGGVAVVEVGGVIHRKAGAISFFGLSFSWSGQDQIREAVAKAMLDPGVGAVLLSFNSPGGVAAGVKELADFITSQRDKPMYAYADGLCASAAYWLASATGRVYAPRTASIGSIGVLHVHCDRSAANAAEGVRYTYITGGAWKSSGNGDAPLSGADQAYLQQMVTSLHDIFRADVIACMGVDAAKPTSWGDGQVFLADDALALGLVTGIVTDRDALIAQVNKEIVMDKEQLAKAHPELLAQIQAEARQEADAAALERSTASAETQAALVKAVAGEGVASMVAKLMEAGFTAKQVEAMESILAIAPLSKDNSDASQPAAEKPGGEQHSAKGESQSPSRAEMLAAIRKATPGPVNTSVNAKEGDTVQAAIDRISAVQV